MVASSIARHWRVFRDDAPGERFVNSYERMQRQGSPGLAIVRGAVGVVLLVIGVALLFIPGPGLLVRMFGFGLLAGESKWLARKLDRAEPRARRRGRTLRRWWHVRSIATKSAIVAAGVACVGAAPYFALTMLQ